MESPAPAQMSTRRMEQETKLAALGFLEIPHELQWEQPAECSPLQRPVSLGVGVGPVRCQTVALRSRKLGFS